MSRTVRVEIETEDGKIISLHGPQAVQWGDLVAGISFHFAVHGGRFPAFGWKKEQRTPEEMKRLELLRLLNSRAR